MLGWLEYFFVFNPIILTGDFARYLWEGKVLRKGFSPYLHSPNSSFLEVFRDSNWYSIEYKNLSAIYPPIAELAFALFAFKTS